MDKLHKIFFIVAVIIILGGFISVNLIDDISSDSSLETFFGSGNSITGLAVADFEGGGDPLTITDTNCWDFDSDEAFCEFNTDCEWFSDPWGSWCSQKGCWNSFSEESCLNTLNATNEDYINKTCAWQNQSSASWCMEINCWSFDGSSESACESNTQGLNCEWVDTYNEDEYDYPCMGPWEEQCYLESTQTACEAKAECEWGACYDVGCWDYDDRTSCVAGTGREGNTCNWEPTYEYCYESGCWDYSDLSTCETNDCTWENGYCHDQSCWDYSFTNATACVNNTINETCTWDNSSKSCYETGCWSITNSTNCDNANSCIWETDDHGGWCEETNCWTYSGTDQGTCEAVTAPSGDACTWDAGSSECYEDYSAFSCTNYNSEKDCIDTFYCMWDAGAETCNEPSGDYEINSTHKVWNPGCYIFDYSQVDCNDVAGCYWNAGTNSCDSNATISSVGLTCADVNKSTLCNAIPALDTCCSWQGSACESTQWSTSCWDQIEEVPEGAAFCEDYNAYSDQTLCEQIAGSPWFMPCEWSSVDEHCEIKNDKIFEDGKVNLAYIGNKQNCEYAGGSWVTNSYCSGDVAVFAGHCEQKFDNLYTCDKSCGACEFKSGGSAWSSFSKAEDACVSSKLGFCGFTEDTSADNGYGECRIKEEAKPFLVYGLTCDDDCSVCTYVGDPFSDTSANRPSTNCKQSEANCKWIADLDTPKDESKGACVDESAKGCEDRCEKCYDEQHCSSYGAKQGDTTLDVACSWDDNTNICLPKDGSAQMEICFDGVDNNNDGKIDCADSICYSDPFCGADSVAGDYADCWGYSDQSTCEDAGCYYVDEDWGSWCDLPGAKCWGLDGNQAACDAESETCVWHAEAGGWCEEDWDSDEFMECVSLDINMTACDNNENCTWFTDDWCSDVGGWCEGKTGYTGIYAQNCWNFDSSQATCEAAVDAVGVATCQWHEDDWCASQGEDAGWCDPVQFSCWQYQDNATCTNATNIAYCDWQEDEWGSWCTERTDGTSCWNQMTSGDCTGVNCNWISGFCDPIGFGSKSFGGDGDVMVGTSSSCWQYDGNQITCETQDNCGWISLSGNNQFCDVDWSDNCYDYSYDENACQTQKRCSWDSGNSFCKPTLETCWSEANPGDCTAKEYCSWSGTFCEPSCFNQANSAACGLINVSINGTAANTNACSWMDGFCEDASIASHMSKMEGGTALKIGSDASADASPSVVDIIGFGMKDMGEAFGISIVVKDLASAAICNDQKLTDGATGNGATETKFYWYFDTDGSDSGSCTRYDDGIDDGYEFYIKQHTIFSNGAPQISHTAHKCVNSEFIVTDIRVATASSMACSEIGGAMITVEKGEFERFNTLYDATADMRVFVASATSTDSVSTPTDVVVPGYVTPGAVDFDIDSLDYNTGGLTGHALSDATSLGYVSYSADCFTSAGCADYSCYNHPYCVANSLGVHAAGFEDTRTPKIVGVSKETYDDGALINYFTDKPADGRLLYYGTDSSCDTLEQTIPDAGLTSNNVRDYRLTHSAELFNESVNISNATIDLSMSNGTLYFYKIKVCDDAGKCAQSKCSNITTENSEDDCPFCEFITRVKIPSTWNISYDLDQDSTYEHGQGLVCGTNAGMLTTQDTGRRANIKLEKVDGTSYFEFVGARLTKTALNSKTSDIDQSSDLATGTTSAQGGGTVGYAGLPSATRDKIVNNLAPEVCRIKIPSSGTCTSLVHCNDDFSACVDRTAEATLLETGSDYCTWQLPFCEFSSWVGGTPGSGSSSSSSSSSSSGGGGGGGGGGSSTATTNEGTVQSNTDSSQTTWTSLESTEPVVMTVDSENIAISQITFDVTETVWGPYLKVQTKEEYPSSVGEINDKIYERYQITTVSTLNEDTLEGVEIVFDVSKSWLSSNSINSTHVAMYRFDDDAWYELTTYLTGESASSYTYTAETPGFSYFGVAYTSSVIENRIVAEEEVEEVVEETVEEESTIPIEEPAFALDVDTQTLIIAIAIAVVLFVGVASFIYHKKKDEDDDEEEEPHHRRRHHKR